VMHRPIRKGISLTAPRNERIQVRLIREGEEDLWAQIAARGWSESTELFDFVLEMGQTNAKRVGTHLFFAELDGQPIATGALAISEGVAHLAGASTVPEGRKQGAQLALLDARLRYGAQQKCDIAMIGAQPGSASQRNAERYGFRIAYTRIKWQLQMK